MRLLSLFPLLPLALAQVPSLSLPPLLGPHKIGTRSIYLPAPNSPSPPRDIMVTVFYPTTSTINSTTYPIAPVYDPAYAAYIETAIGLPTGLASSLLSQAHLNAPLYNPSKNGRGHFRDSGYRNKNHPNIVLFSPGYGGSRLDYTATLSNLASRGYIAIGVDHPNDTTFISYPNGRTLQHVPLALDETSAAEVVDLRVRDFRFVLDALSRKADALPRLKGKLNFNKVGIFGHSIGGAASASAILADKRFIAGSNLDGFFWGPVVQKGIKNAPFLIIASEYYNSSNVASWASFWKNSKGGFEAEIQVKGARHGSFSDQGVLYGVLRELGLIPDLDPNGEAFGTIGGRILNVQDGYLTAFFNYAFKGKKDKLLKGPSKEFPEVSFYPI